MRHIAVNFYESFHSTDWAEREYHYLSIDDDLEYGEILAVYTTHGISIARFRRYLDESESHAETYVAKRLNMKVTGETTSLVEDTKKDILLENLDHLTKRKETIRLAELYAENDKDISSLLSAYKDLGSVSGEDKEDITQEVTSDEESSTFDKIDFLDERFEGVSIHEGEISYRYIEEDKMISVFYVNTNEDIADLKEKLTESGATLVGETRTEHLSQLSNGEAFIVYTELLESRFKFFSILTLDSFKEQEVELQAIPLHYKKEKSYNEQDVVKHLNRLHIKYEIDNSLMASIVTDHLIDKGATFIRMGAKQVKEHDYNESEVIAYASIVNDAAMQNDLFTSNLFVHAQTVRQEESYEDEIEEDELSEGEFNIVVRDAFDARDNSEELTWL